MALIAGKQRPTKRALDGWDVALRRRAEFSSIFHARMRRYVAVLLSEFCPLPPTRKYPVKITRDRPQTVGWLNLMAN